MGFLILLIYLIAPILIMWAHKKFKVCRAVGSIILAYVIGIIISLSGIADIEVSNTNTSLFISNNFFDLFEVDKVQTILQTICVPFAIALMLFSSNFRMWLSSLKQTLIAFVTGILAVVVSVLIGYFIFVDAGINELPKAGALMIGFYTGGTPNVASLKIALNPTAETFMLVNTFEIMITFFFLLFLLMGGYKTIRYLFSFKFAIAGGKLKIIRDLEYKVNLNKPINTETKKGTIEANDFESYAGITTPKNIKGLLLPFFIASGVFIAGALLSLSVSSDYRVVMLVLVVTTLSILLSFWKKLQQTPKLFELGMYFILVFSIVVASDFKLDSINTNTIGLFKFIVFVVCSCVILHMILARLFKIDADLFTIASVGLIFSPPFVPTVASAMNNKACLLSGIVIGLLGYAVGNYFGIIMYALLSYLG